MYSKFPAITKTTPANHFPKILQQQHFKNTFTNPNGYHISIFILHQIEVKRKNEPLKVEQPALESSNEMDELPCKTDTKHSPDTKLP